MFSYDILASLPHGEERMKYLKKGIAEADNEKDLHQQMYRRYYYIRESTFYGDDLDSLIVFPELLKLYEDHPSIMPPEDLKYPFEWMLENSSNFYQVTLPQIENYLARYKDFCNKNGITKRTYLLRASSLYETIDLDISAKLLEDMENCGVEGDPRDEIETATKIHRAAQLGQLEKAVSLLNDYLALGMSNDDLPEQMFGDLAYEFAKRGHYKEATHYASIMMPYIKNNEVNSFRQCGYVLALRSVTDPTAGIDLFERCAGIYSRTRNSIYRFDFANGAYRLFEKLEKMQKENNELAVLKLRLSPDFELYRKDGIYDPAVLKDFFYGQAKTLAQKMDERNHNHYISDMLAEEYPGTDSVKPLDLPLHGKTRALPHIVGLFFKDKADMPDEDFIIKAITDMGYTFGARISDSPDADTSKGMSAFTVYDKYGKPVKFGLILNNDFDPNDLNIIQYIPDELMETLPQFTEKLIMTLYLPDSDPFRNITETLRLADKLNTGGAPVIADMNSYLLHPSLWVHTMAIMGECPPTDRLISFNFAMDDIKGTLDITTVGLNLFGIREFIARDIPNDKEKIHTVIEYLQYIADQAISGYMPDEGRTAPSGMVYDNNSHIRFSWEVVRYDEDTPKDHINEFFAEPVLYLTAADAKAGKGLKLSEISAEDASKIKRGWSYRRENGEVKRCAGLFYTAKEYLMNHTDKCRMHIYASFIDKDNKDHQLMGYMSVGTKGELLLTVEKCRDESTSPAKPGDTVTIEPKNIDMWVLLADDGSGEFKAYYPEDMYILLYND